MKVVWLQRLTCCGNTHSFLNYPYMETLLERVEFLFHPSFSLEGEEEKITSLLEKDVEIDLLIVEGAVMEEDRSLLELANRARWVMAVGNCAVYGNIPAINNSHVSGLSFRFTEKGGPLKDFVSKGGLPVINISGCPAHPEWICGTMLMLAEGVVPSLDEWNRPKAYYSDLTHWGCVRNEYFEWKVEPSWLGSPKGCLFYKFGCRGPMTHSTCNRILWNGVSSKTRAGTPCFGCTEYNFPKVGLWETKTLAGIPAELPIGVSKRGYIMLAGVAKMFAPERLKDDS
ncbi:NADH ubiquinone oxidoreductase 20 kDa subunit [Thermocrinis albus DSM 14484]|uniref:NADH ubiquinone oxidoreductase 20 kDa subunit n=1 Tax=Thermocrinis albus (strain DSM 14484 / JCM 11386 / HI 11/12) TaxID=638303 RepID=D3SMR2_THEAH|nr:Ni/Fe hydrogenase [Thermocrinis albus]ADC90042.1 NADH ubiquinone oxidoreductase 20 kDa subunit [Thermocrinis albus DSM 14484]